MATAAAGAWAEEPDQAVLQVSAEGASQSASSSQAHLTLPEDVLDGFDRSGTPNELLGAWSDIEVRVLTPEEGPKVQDDLERGLPPQAREVAAWCLQRVLHEFRLAVDAWFHTMALLDAYIIRASHRGTAESLAELPRVCAVLARMVKNDSPAGCYDPSCVAGVPSMVARYLTIAGFPVDRSPDPTWEELSKTEHDVLRTIRWRTVLPDLAQWITAFYTRLDVLTSRQRSDHIHAVRQCVLSLARFFVTKEAPSAEFPPQRLARGFLVMSMTEVPPDFGGGPEQLTQALMVAAAASAQALQGDLRIARQALRYVGGEPMIQAFHQAIADSLPN